MKTHPYGFRIVGAMHEARRLIDWAVAFSAHAACDPIAKLETECYLSAFTYDDQFLERVDAYKRVHVKDYPGPCWATWLWFDIDYADDLARATVEARRLATTLDERYRLADDTLLIFFSGSKGFHIGLPTWLWQPEPSTTFHRIARQMAETLASVAQVTIDTQVYDKVRAFRAPNSRHPRTGLHKRRLTFDELLHLSVERIVELAAEPAPFDIPETGGVSDTAQSDWIKASEAVEQHDTAMQQRRESSSTSTTLNRATLEFITSGARDGERHSRLFSAAANLAELGCPPALAHALLTEPARDSGLPPKEVARVIQCGLDHKGATP